MARIVNGRLAASKDKAAALILTLTDENKKNLFTQFKEREIWALTSSMSTLGVIEPPVLKNVLMDFMHLMKQGSAVVGGFEDTKKMLESVMGKDKASAVLQGVVGDAEGVWEQLSEVSAAMLSKFLKTEDPQTSSVILSRLAPSRTAQILRLYDEGSSLDLLVRILGAAPIKGAVLGEIQNFLKTEFMEEFKRNADAFDAHIVVAEIMNALDQKTSDKMLEELDKRLPESATRVRNLMFTFDDLMRIDGPDIQKIISSCDKARLAVALKGVPTSMSELFLANMSERAGKLLSADIEALGGVRASDVEKAQREILNMTKDLERKGEITIPEAGDDDTVIS